jgi:hypothetical protein
MDLKKLKGIVLVILIIIDDVVAVVRVVTKKQPFCSDVAVVPGNHYNFHNSSKHASDAFCDGSDS